MCLERLNRDQRITAAAAKRRVVGDLGVRAARHHLTVVKRRGNVRCTSVPALTCAPALCPKGDSCSRLRTSVQATSRTDIDEMTTRRLMHRNSPPKPRPTETGSIPFLVGLVAYYGRRGVAPLAKTF